MKICSQCKQEKELLEFNRRKSSKDGYQARCRECNKNNLKKHYVDNLDYYRNKSKTNKKILSQLLKSIKSESSCYCCNENDAACLDFHHLSNKEHLVSRLPSYGSKSKFLNEISKCVLICSNCHRKIHKHNRSIEEQKLIMTT